MSQIVYVMQTLIAPDSVLIEINRFLFRFLWRNIGLQSKGIWKVKRSVVCNQIKNGGLNMMRELQIAFLLQWVVIYVKKITLKIGLGIQDLCTLFLVLNLNASIPMSIAILSSVCIQTCLIFFNTVPKTWIDSNCSDANNNPLWNVKYAEQVLYFK